MLSHVKRLVLECQEPLGGLGEQGLLYHGQWTKKDVVTHMQSLGFDLERCWPNNDAIGEQNCVFARPSVLVHGLLDDCFKASDLVLLNREAQELWGDNAENGSLSMGTLGNSCCGEDYLQVMRLGCFDLEFTREKCCL